MLLLIMLLLLLLLIMLLLLLLIVLRPAVQAHTLLISSSMVSICLRWSCSPASVLSAISFVFATICSTAQARRSVAWQARPGPAGAAFSCWPHLGSTLRRLGGLLVLLNACLKHLLRVVCICVRAAALRAPGALSPAEQLLPCHLLVSCC